MSHSYVTGSTGNRISGCIDCGYKPTNYLHRLLNKIRGGHCNPNRTFA